MGTGLSALTGLAALLVVGMLALILWDVIRGGAAVISWEFLTAAPTEGMTEGGIFPAIYGTAVLTLVMTVAVMPVGVATAVYLHEYAPPRSRLAGAVRVAVTNLAGVPSIVFGLFGLGFFIQFVGRGMDRLLSPPGVLRYGQPALIWAALTLAVLTLPVVIVATEEALRAVPRELRDASLALGATRSQTLARVVLPGALPGILTGAILAVARGAGEVAPILFTGVAYFLPRPARLGLLAVHAPRLPHLRARHAVAGHRGHPAASVRDGARAAGPHLHAEPGRHCHPHSHAPARRRRPLT